MVTQAEFKQHYEDLYKNGAIYVWGANCEIITQTLTDKLYKTFGSKTYTKTYYSNKLKEGKGKKGADCSGSIFPLSQKDNTAKGYYQACKVKGSINDLPEDTACLVFNSGFTHVGAYLGNGTTIEMMNSQRNCVKQNFQKARWSYFGIPDWLETDLEETPDKADAPVVIEATVIKNIQKWCNSYAGLNIDVDGYWGPETKKALCKALQHCLNVKYKAGLDEDGSFGPKTKKACKAASSARELTYICQAMLYCKGYDMSHSIKNNDFDKSYGSGTKATVLKYQQDTRGLRHDGKCGPATFYAMFNS